MKLTRVELGQVYGHLTVIRKAESSATRQARWVARCTCGSEFTYYAFRLKNGAKTICGECSRRKWPMEPGDGILQEARDEIYQLKVAADAYKAEIASLDEARKAYKEMNLILQARLAKLEQPK